MPKPELITHDDDNRFISADAQGYVIRDKRTGVELTVREPGTCDPRTNLQRAILFSSMITFAPTAFHP